MTTPLYRPAKRGRAAVPAAAAVVALALLASCGARSPGRAETALVDELKKTSIGGKGWNNPVPATPESVQKGAEHFRHHCQICHGLDGHNTGVPFADKMSPPVADLGDKDVQEYKDGQLKWIIENGIRFTGMPGWKGILDDEEMWAIVRYLRQLPPKGSLGAPQVYQEGEEEHTHDGEGKGQIQPASSEKKPHTHSHQHKH